MSEGEVVLCGRYRFFLTYLGLVNINIIREKVSSSTYTARINPKLLT